MIAVDTSALLEVALRGPEFAYCKRVLQAADHCVISAGTLTEALIVSRRRAVGEAVETIVEQAGIEVLPVTAAEARRVADAYDRWGKGVHPAGLNWGDCFAYAVALARRCPLLFVGSDFSRTDVERAAE